MHKVLFVIDSLDYSGAARQLALLAPALPPDRFSVRVAVLGPSSPWAEQLRAAGVLVHALDRRRPFDVRPYFELRALARERGLTVHVWGAPALRAVVLSGARAPGRLFASACLPPSGQPGWIERWALRRAARVVARGEVEAERYRRLGVAHERVAIVPRAVAPGATAAPASWPAVPSDARVVLGIGPIERHKGFGDATWAFDILAHLRSDIHLVVVGGGTDRARVVHFAHALRVEKRVHFPGPVPDLGPWLARADMVWVPSLREGGHTVALEAQAAGKPVLASRLPGLAELVGDGGLLVPPGDKAALARQTHVLLNDAGLSERLGAAGRRWAERFGVAEMVEAAARLYPAGSVSR